MAKNKELTLEEKLREALIPKEEQPYEIPESWEWVNYRAIFNEISSNNKKIQQKNYLEAGKIAIVDQGKDLIGGYTNNMENPYKEELPVIVFGDHTLNIKYIDFPFYIGADGVKVLKTTNSYNTKFLYYFLKNLSINKLGYRRHFSILKTYSFVLPPLEEQKRIVEKLDFMFEKINKAKELIQEVKENIENRKESILNKAFRGELTAEWRKNNQTEEAIELLKSINEEKIKNWEQACIEAEKSGKKKPSKPKIEEIENIIISKEEEPYEIPKNWKWTKLKNICFSFTYGTSEKSSIEGKIPVIRMGNLQKGKIIYKNLAYTSNLLEIEKYKLKKGDILFNRTNSPELVGKTALFDGKQNCIYAGYLIKIEFPQNRVIPYYFNQYMQTNYIKQVCLNVKSDGVSQSNINAQKLSNFIFPLPPLKEQEKIVRILDEILEKESKIKELIELEEAIELLEKSILDKAFRGKLGTQNKNDEPAIELKKKIKNL